MRRSTSSRSRGRSSAAAPSASLHLEIVARDATGAAVAHAGGDEFTEQEHHLILDGDTLRRWTPWRTDCGAYRRFNPTSGFWPSSYVYGGDTLEERVASSDLSRSNWCPGDAVHPIRIPLGDLSAGDHTLEIAIPGAQVWTDSTFNFWNTAATLHWQ